MFKILSTWLAFGPLVQIGTKISCFAYSETIKTMISCLKKLRSSKKLGSLFQLTLRYLNLMGKIERFFMQKIFGKLFL